MRHVFIFAFAAFLSLMAFAAEPEQVLSELKSKVAPDKRTAVWDVRAETQDGKTVILGTVGTSTQRDVINNVLRMNDITDYDNRVIVLEQTLPESHRNALVKLAVATLRTEPKHSAEVATSHHGHSATRLGAVRRVAPCSDARRLHCLHPRELRHPS